VSEEFRDENGDPLLKDLSNIFSRESAHISEHYSSDLDYPIMRAMGTRTFSLSDFLARLTQDLNAVDSRMQNNSDDVWHTKVADLLIKATKVAHQKECIQKLKIIPLQNGRWAPAWRASVFLPSSGDVKIPEGLPLSLVNEKALLNSSRETLFSELGIRECAPSRIFPLIEQRYSSNGRLTMAVCRQDIKFLFWHNAELPNTGYSIIVLANNGKGYTNSFIRRPSSVNWLYCPESEDTYAMFNLQGSLMPSELKDHVSYLQNGYYETLNECGVRNNLSGKDWLRSQLAIKETPQLRRKSVRGAAPQLSAEVEYIAIHEPQRLLGVLHANWIDYHQLDGWDRFFKSIEVPILHSSVCKALESTYLPLPRLKTIVSELNLENSFGFLAEIDGISNIEEIKWGFLEKFGVGVREDVSFWIELLDQARSKEDLQKEVIFKIYSRLQTFSGAEEIEKLR
jgi:hypothetical protein